MALPTVALESLLVTLPIDVYKGRDAVCTMCILAGKVNSKREQRACINETCERLRCHHVLSEPRTHESSPRTVDPD